MAMLLGALLIFPTWSYGQVEQVGEQDGVPIVSTKKSGGGITEQGFFSGVESVNTMTDIMPSLGKVGNEFALDDLDLVNGVVKFTETDLVLPGKGGLNLTINRLYSSQFYRTKADPNPIDNRMWGGWGGNGWSFGFGTRVFVVKLHRDTESTENRVIVQRGPITEEYVWDGTVYRSKIPGNYTVAEFTYPKESTYPNKVVLKLANGSREVYEDLFYFERYIRSGLSVPDFVGQLSVSGLYLSKMEDINGNTIQINYETVQSDLTVDFAASPRPVEQIIGKDSYDALYKAHTIGSKEAVLKFKRPNRVIDSMNREVRLNYEESNNNHFDQKNRPYMITSFDYQNTNGKWVKFAYNYDSNGNMTDAKLEGVPGKKYEYQNYVNRFHLYYISVVRHSDGKFYNLYIADFEWGAFANTKYTTTNDNLDNFRGDLLKKVTHSMGSSVEYTYSEILQQLQIENHGISPKDYGYGYFTIPVSGVFVNTAHPVVSGPVVSGKTIHDGHQSYAYKLSYPTTYYNNVNHIYKNPFTPSYSTQAQYYFSKVEVDMPAEMEDQTFVFDKGLLVSQTQGIYRTEQEWDFDQLRLKSVKNYKDNVLQKTQTMSEFDAFNHPLKVVTESGPYRSETTSAYFPPITEHNLIHLLANQTVKSGDYTKAHRLEYDGLGRPVRVYQGSASSMPLVSETAYDAAGRPVEETRYGPGGQLKSQTQYEESSSVYRVRQTVNGKTQVSEYSPYTGALLRSQDANGNEVKHLYDDRGFLTEMIYPDGSRKTQSVSNDLRTITTSYGGKSITVQLDELGRKKLVDRPAGEQDEAYDYYFQSLPSKIKRQENGNWVDKKTITYDQYLRKVSETVPQFGTTTYAYDTPAFNAVTVTDPDGRQTVQQMDEAGLTKTSTFKGDNSLTQFQHDSFGQLLNTIDPRGISHRMTYDDRGRVKSALFPNSSQVRSQQTYSAEGVLIGTTVYDRDGSLFRQFDYGYDNEGRITQLKLNGTAVETTQYDTAPQGKNKVASIENTDTKTRYSYDTMGRITEEAVTVKAANNREYSVGYSYDLAGNLSSLRYPDGNKQGYSYNELQQLTAITWSDLDMVRYTYNENGTVKQLIYPNGITIDYSYERDVLLTQITAKRDGKVLYSQRYNYDQSGRMLNTTHSDYFRDDVSPTVAAVKRDYGYTVRDELAQVKLNGDVRYQFAYDKNGNVTRFESAFDRGLGGTNMQYSSNEDLLMRHVRSDALGNGVSFSYDAVGNVIEKRKESRYSNGESVTENFVYNYQDQITAVHRNGNLVAEYGYDAKRQRVYRKVMDGSSAAVAEAGDGRVYAWDLSGRIIAEMDGKSGQQWVRYLYSGNEKVAMQRYEKSSQQWKWYWFINNAQGTPVMIVDQQGTVVSRLNLDEWGNVGTVVGPLTEVNYTGKKLDLETGLYYFNQRYYNPSIGRFMSEDPAAQLLNPYVYAGNNPVMYMDPDGEFFFLAPLVGAIVTGAVYGAGMGAIAGAAIAAYNGTNILEGAFNGAISGGLTGALGGGVGFGLGALAGGGGFIGQFAGMTQGALEWSGYANTALAVGKGFATGDWSQAIGAGVFMGGGVLASKGMNPIANFAQGVGQSAAGMIDSRYGFKNHVVGSRTEIDANGNTSTTKYEWHGDDPEMAKSMQRIMDRKPHPHYNDGTVFRNKEGLLPQQSRGYYREFVHPTPGVEHAGLRRIILGRGGEIYYSPDHYDSFYRY